MFTLPPASFVEEMSETSLSAFATFYTNVICMYNARSLDLITLPPASFVEEMSETSLSASATSRSATMPSRSAPSAPKSAMLMVCHRRAGTSEPMSQDMHFRRQTPPC